MGSESYSTAIKTLISAVAVWCSCSPVVQPEPGLDRCMTMSLGSGETPWMDQNWRGPIVLVLKNGPTVAFLWDQTRRTKQTSLPVCITECWALMSLLLIHWLSCWQVLTTRCWEQPSRPGIFTLAHFSCFQHIHPWEVPLLEENKCHSLHLSVILMLWLLGIYFQKVSHSNLTVEYFYLIKTANNHNAFKHWPCKLLLHYEIRLSFCGEGGFDNCFDYLLNIHRIMYITWRCPLFWFSWQTYSEKKVEVKRGRQIVRIK